MLSSPRPSQGSRQVSTRSVQTASSRSGAATDAVTPHPEAPSLAPGSFATSRKTYGLCGQPALREPYRLSAAGCLDLVGRFSQSEWIHGEHWPVAVAASFNAPIASDWAEGAPPGRVIGVKLIGSLLQSGTRIQGNSQAKRLLTSGPFASLECPGNFTCWRLPSSKRF